MKLGLDVPPREDRAFDVVGLGENSLDLMTFLPAFPAPNAKVPIRRAEYLPGGQVTTALVALSRLGYRTQYLGTFGDDDHGRAGVENLRREDVDITRVRRASGASRFAVVLVDEHDGTRTVLYSRPSSLALPADEISADTVCGGRVLLVDTDDLAASVRAASIARASGIPVVVDVDAPLPGIEALLEEVDVIIAAEALPLAMTGTTDQARALGALAERYPRASVLCVTLGDRGSLARVRGVEVRTPAFPIACVDTTGAGDAFRGGFIARWLEQGGDADVEDVLRAANAVAALNCRALGAQTACPSRAEVSALLARVSSSGVWREA